MTKIYKTSDEARRCYYLKQSLLVNWVAYWGPNNLIELISLAKSGVIKPVVQKHSKVGQSTEALQMLKYSKILGRDVISR